MENYNPMPYVAKILRETLLKEEKNLSFFENNLNSEDPSTKRQAEGSLASNKSRIEELKSAIEHLKTYKKQKK